MKKYTLLLVLSLGLILPIAGQVQASDKQRVISHVKQTHKGRLLSADPEKDSSKYRVKVLKPDGRVKVIRVDAKELKQERR